tara:strand:- start:5524 stop:7206 length:1683 start_codon:yes stop_codon:yes gene_type:complete
MCGIFGLVNYKTINRQTIYKSFNNGKNRGPEFSITKEVNNIFFGFHRLAINGLNDKSNQPFDIKNCILICNGEIYNFKELAKNNNINLTTQSDCEIIIHLYKLYGIEYTLQLLDGVFAFLLYDKTKDAFYVARDPYGVRPLYFYNENNIYGFASEIKSIYEFTKSKDNIKSFLPGNYLTISNVQNEWYYKAELKKYYNMLPLDIDYDNMYFMLVNKLKNAVEKRIVGTTDRPVACLLSGGLDSSLIAALVSKELKKSSLTNEKLKTFSIGLPNSEDLKYAKIVANHIDSDHHEIILTDDEFFNAIPEVINKIESYDTTTVRASVGNYLIAKYISEMSDCKVIFNGDGADELMGGYLYFKHAPDEESFDEECKRLLSDIHIFDVLRSDRSISSNGLEARTPFLDKDWVNYYLSLDKSLRYKTTVEKCEKYIIRKSFSHVEPDLLPDKILWRTKEAFSDGVSGLNKSWYEIINDKLTTLNDNDLFNNIINTQKEYQNGTNCNNIPETIEQSYYRYLFNLNFKHCDHIIPYFWMPKFINAKDASARSLLIYNKNNTNTNKQTK